MGEVRPVRVRRAGDHAVPGPANAGLEAHEDQALRRAPAVAEVTAIPLQWLEVQPRDVVLAPHGPALVLDVAAIEGDELRVWWTRGPEAGFIDVDPWGWVPVERTDPVPVALATIYRAFPTTQIIG